MVNADRVCVFDPEIAVGGGGSRTRLISRAGTPDEIVSRLGVVPDRVMESAKELGRGSSTEHFAAVRTAEIIGTLCLATDLGMGFPFEHGLRTTDRSR